MKDRRLVFIFGALLLVSIAWMAAGQDPMDDAEEQQPDLAVVDIRIIGDQPRWTEDEPTDTRVEVTVENRGGTAASSYSLTYEWDGGDGPRPMNGDNRSSFDAGDSLPAGEERAHEAPWRLQEDQVGNGTLIVTATTEPDPDRSNDVGRHRIFVPLHDIDLVIPGDDNLTVYPDASTFLSIHAVNEGNVPGTVDLDVEDVEVGNRSYLVEELLPTALEVPPGGTAVSKLITYYPFEGETVDFNASYPVQMETGYGASMEGTTPVVNVSYDAAPSDIPFSFQREGSGTLFAGPDETITSRFLLRNDGDRREVYTVVERSAPGWNVSMPRQIWGLFSQEGSMGEVSLSPRQEVERGSSTELRLTVASNMTGERQTFTVPLQVTGFTGSIQDPRVNRTHLYQGENATFNLDLHNGGNQPTPDSTTLEFRFWGPDDRLVEANQTMGPVDAGTAASVSFDVALQDPGRALVEATWMGPDGDGVLDRVSWAEWVRSGQINVTSALPATAVPGQVVSYTAAPHAFAVENEGDRPERLRLAVESSPGDASVLGGSLVVLDPGDRRIVPVRQHLPAQLDTLEVPLNLTVRIDDRPRFRWEAGTTTTVEDPNPPLLRFDPAPAGIGVVSQAFPIAVEAEDGTGIRTVEAVVSSPDGDSVTVPFDRRDGRWELDLTFEQTGNHSILVQAEDHHGNNATLGPHKIRVADVQDVAEDDVQFLSPEQGASVTGNTSVTIVVSDPSNVSFAVLRARTPSGELLDRSPLSFDDSGVAVYELSDLEPGETILQTEVIRLDGGRLNATLPLTIEDPGKDNATGSSDAPQEDAPTRDRASPAIVPGLGVPGIVVGLVVVAYVVSRRRSGPP